MVAVAAAIFVLHRAGGGQLGPPPLGDPAGWARWAAERDPIVAALAIVRVLALGAVWYLLVATVLGGVFRVLRAGRLVAITDWLTIPALRRLLVATAGVTLAAGISPTLALARSAPSDVAAVTTTSSTATTTTIAGSRTSPTLTMRLLGPDGPAPASPGPAASIAPSVERGPPAPAVGAVGATWTVRPGECFWSIADDVLARAWGRVPSDAEIVPYWRTLIEANRHALADRSNADLIFPGQVFTVPAPPAAGA